MLITLATTLGVAVLVVICLLSIGKFFVKGFEFWPPPSPDSWQHSVFRWLFRVFFVTLIVLSVLDFQSDSVWRYLIGAVLFLVGFGLAVRWTGFLGWRDAFGDPNKLKSTGPFAWSRYSRYGRMGHCDRIYLRISATCGLGGTVYCRAVSRRAVAGATVWPRI